MQIYIQPLDHIIDIRKLADVAAMANRAVKNQAVRDHLRDRHLLSVVRAHQSSSRESETQIFNARRANRAGELGVYALSVASKYVGLATVNPKPQLIKQATGFRGQLLSRWLSKPVEYFGPEVTAWVDPSIDLQAPDTLENTYKILADETGIAHKEYEAYRALHACVVEPVQAWTIEPLDTPGWVHRAIKRAGYSNAAQDRGLYDNGESHHVGPPPSLLYIAAYHPTSS